MSQFPFAWNVYKRYCGSGIKAFVRPYAPPPDEPAEDTPDDVELPENPGMAQQDNTRPSGDMAHAEPSKAEDEDEKPDPSLPRGARISLVDNYKITPAEQAGIKEGDIITHAMTPSGPREINSFKEAYGFGIGPVLSPQRFMVHTPGDPKGPREVTVRREWIVEIPYYDRVRSEYTPEQIREIIAKHMDDIPKRSPEDDACELFSSLEPLATPRLATAPTTPITRNRL